MSNGYFRFKQFTVWHDQCAMKVGTDGVLLGAWVDLRGCRSILDVGVGSGLIALMLAQRESAAFVEGVDIDPAACRQALENVSCSPFADRIRVSHTSFYSYVKEKEAYYDLVVSNPPFFANSLKSPNEQRAIARQGDESFLRELLEGGRSLLTPRGRIAMILPSSRWEELLALLEEFSLSIVRHTEVIPLEGRAAKRFLVELGAFPCSVVRPDRLVLKEASLQQTAAYRALTEPFYL